MKKLLTSADVAEALALKKRDTAAAYMKKHMSEYLIILPGGDYRIREDDLQRWLTAQTAPAGSAPAQSAPAPRKKKAAITYNADLFEPDGKGGLRIKRRRGGKSA